MTFSLLKRSMVMAFLAAALILPGQALATISLKVAHGAPESTAVHAGWLHFKKIVEERSKGEFAVEIYGNQQLGGDREITEATQLGNIQASSASTANVAPFVADFFIFDMPFIFKDQAQVYAMLDGAPGKATLEECAKVELKGLGFMENGFRHLTNSRRTINSPKDLEGIKLRTMENPIQMAAWRALGANPTPMAFGEVYTALQQKTVDGQENPMELIYNNKFFEVQHYFTLTNHIYSPYSVMFNLDWWNDLKPEHSAMIEKAMQETIDFQRSIVTESAEKAEAAIRANGNEITTLTPENFALFREKAQSAALPMIKERVRPEVFKLFLEQ